MGMFQYLSRFSLAPLFSEEEFRHWFLPQPGIVDSYIVENNGEVTGKLEKNPIATFPNKATIIGKNPISFISKMY